MGQQFVLTALLALLMVAILVLTIKVTGDEIVAAVNGIRNKNANLGAELVNDVNLVEATRGEKRGSLLKG